MLHTQIILYFQETARLNLATFTTTFTIFVKEILYSGGTRLED